MNKCQICGAECLNKFCKIHAKEGYLLQRRKQYRETHEMYEKFYVFYDKNDFVICFGTAKELVEDGAFKSINAVHSRISKIRALKIPGKVLTLKCRIYND